MKKTFLKARKFFLDPLAWYLSKKELHRLMNGDNIEEAIQAADRYVGRGFYSSLFLNQEIEEITGFCRWIKEKQPKTIVEIGTFKGGTLFLWCRTLLSARSIISIDLPDQSLYSEIYIGGYHSFRKKFYKEFLFDRPGARLDFIQRSSHDIETLNMLKEKLGGKKIDFLFIDGDHTYEGVKKDFEMYSPLVEKGGAIALHDILTTCRGCDVVRFWKELKNNHQTSEFIAPGSNKGIGVLQNGE